MELTEKIESLNQQLIDLYGIDTATGQAQWRIVWSDDQLEKRRTDYSPSGIKLPHPMVYELPKYSYIKGLYVLERLVVIPQPNQDDLPDAKLSYEPMWVFQDAKGDYLPPHIQASKFVIDTVYAAMGKTSLRKYVDSEMNTTEEGRQAKVSAIQSELFGNETDTGDALAYKEGVTVPSNYEKKES
jgi:hypothetical protein